MRFPRLLAVTAIAGLLLRGEFSQALTPQQIPHILNYQGRVSVGAAAFNGNGVFRFALVNGAGNITYWSNDGTSVNGVSPQNAVTLSVTQGFYTVALGDSSVPNMTPIPTS